MVGHRGAYGGVVKVGNVTVDVTGLLIEIASDAPEAVMVVYEQGRSVGSDAFG